MSDEKLEFGFGSMVKATISGHDVNGEVIATPEDNRDLSEGQYILALGAEADFNDELRSEEIVHQKSIYAVIED